MGLRGSTEGIVLHCSATLENQPHNRASIRQMHLERGWSDIGYHWVIKLDGTVEPGRVPEKVTGAHVGGFNERTMGVVYVGGLRLPDAKPTDTRTAAQKTAMELLLRDILTRYPNAVILGHRDLSPDLDKDGIIEPYEYLKACPCFNAGPWARSKGLPGGWYDWKSRKFKRLGAGELHTVGD